MILNRGKNFGFTMIELLVVIAIIGLISSVVMASLSSARKKSRDARRLMDMKQIQLALELYYDTYKAYPDNTDNDSGTGWDVGYYGVDDHFILPLETAGIMSRVPGDPIVNASYGGYRYYRYPPGYQGCDASRGSFYVLAITDMETSNWPYPGSPGWRCPTRDWQQGSDWVTGSFEQ